MKVLDDGSGPALYVGGAFTEIGGIQANAIARWNGKSWSTLGSGFLPDPFGFESPFVYDVALFDAGDGAALYAGGHFALPAAPDVRGLGRFRAGEWEPVAVLEADPVQTSYIGLGVLHVLESRGGPRLLIGGSFVRVGGVDAMNVAIWDGVDWSALGAGLAAPATPATGRIWPSVTDLLELDGAGGLIAACGDIRAVLPDRWILTWDGAAWTGDYLPVPSLGTFVRQLVYFDDGDGRTLYVLARRVNGHPPILSGIGGRRF